MQKYDREFQKKVFKENSWAKWIAVDKSGACYAYQIKPFEIFVIKWDTDCYHKAKHIVTFTTNFGNWKNSLVYREEVMKEPKKEPMKNYQEIINMITRTNEHVGVLEDKLGSENPKKTLMAEIEKLQGRVKDIEMAMDPLNDPKCPIKIGGFIIEKEKAWTPKVGENYWIVDIQGDAFETENFGWNSDRGSIAVGNCYRTKEEAEQTAERVKKAYRGE